MDWYPRSWPMSQSFCTPPDPSPPIGKFLPGQWWTEFRQKILRAPHSGTYSYRVFHGRVSENKGILQECCSWYMQMNGSVWKSQYWSFNPCITIYISHAPSLRCSQCRFKREVQNDHPGDGCTAPSASCWRWRDCTMHTSREWHQCSLRWHSIAAKCIGDFL